MGSSLVRVKVGGPSRGSRSEEGSRFGSRSGSRLWSRSGVKVRVKVVGSMSGS